MKSLLCAIVAVLCCFIAPSAAAQHGRIETKLIDADGEPVPFANVVLFQDEQLAMGTVSDLDGNVDLKQIPFGTYTFQVSSLGYDKVEQEIEVGAKKRAVKSTIVMESRAITLTVCEINTYYVDHCFPQYTRCGGVAVADCFMLEQFPTVDPGEETPSAGPVVGTDKPMISSQVSVYPNPTRGLATLKTDTPIHRLEVFDMNGTLIWQTEQTVPMQTIDFSQHPVGTYLVRLNDGELGNMVRLVKVD